MNNLTWQQLKDALENFSPEQLANPVAITIGVGDHSESGNPYTFVNGTKGMDGEPYHGLYQAHNFDGPCTDLDNDHLMLVTHDELMRD